jgi:hypothetical protein
LLNNAKAPNNKLVDLQATDSCSADCQPTNSERANGERPNRYCGKHQ